MARVSGGQGRNVTGLGFFGSRTSRTLTEADGQILGAQDGGQGRGTGREARAAAILRPRITASLPAIQRTSGERFEIGTKAIVIADGGFRATPSYSALGAAAAVIG
jgi:hypothetical protein